MKERKIALLLDVDNVKIGADAFEEFMAKQGDKDKDKAPVGVAPVKKDGKSR